MASVSGDEAKRVVVQDIRATKFGIGSSSKRNPLALDMHQAITHLSAELYQKDLHFIMELVQNADDNTYAEGVVPELEFVLVEADVADVGVEWTLLVLNNEVGFSKANVESLCSIGLSTKKGKRDSGYIGEKGIGFKSVFLITSHPIVISNGFRIRFNDAPTEETDLGFIVPEWAEQPSNADLLECLGVCELPNTIIVLPVRPDKVQAMREQLFQLSPQLVLFLNKIEKLSVRQLNFSRSSNGVPNSKDMCVRRHRSPSPSSWSSFLPNTCTHSVVHLSSANQEAVYHLWQQEFPVCVDHEVEHRRDIRTWMITLAFPLRKEQRSDTGPDLYAFLPTKVTAGFPFLINADFLLVSSRENIRFESLWNKGILSCIPEAFMAAFMFFLKAASHYPSADTQLRSIYNNVPCRTLSIKELGFVREAILEQMKKHDTILCDANLGQQFSAPFFCVPHLARTIHPEFGCLLQEANEAKISPPKSLVSQMMYIVDAEVVDSYQSVLNTLKVGPLNEQNYIEIVKSPDWLESLTEAMYVKVLYFLSHHIRETKAIDHLPLFKYLDEQNSLTLRAPGGHTKDPVYMSKLSKDEHILSSWRPTFQPWVRVHFMPTKTVQAINHALTDLQQRALRGWLKQIAKIQELSVQSYGESLVRECRKRKTEIALIVGTMHYFLNAVYDGYLSLDDCCHQLSELPLIDSSGSVFCDFTGPVLLPASVCKWPRILLHNSWKGDVLCLSESYLKVPSTMPGNIQAEEVVHFLKQAVGAVDIFDIQYPPNAPIVIPAPWELSREDVTQFLGWIMWCRPIPSKFKASLRDSAWVKTIDHGNRLPSRSILDLGQGQWAGVLESKDVPFVDTGFYGNLGPYKSILRDLGMVTEVQDGGNAVAEHVRELAREGVSDVHSDTAIRWYKFLRLRNWMEWSTIRSTEKLIWVPSRRTQSVLWSALGSWVCPDECIISDDGGLFQERLVVLSKYYKDEFVLAFFSQNMRVAATPGTEKYCQLWVDWGESRREVSTEECENAWRIISKGWESCSRAEADSFKSRCRVPCFTANEGDEQIELARPEEVLYADNLIMAEVFSSQTVKFAWYPRSAAAASWVEELIKCYTELGVKKLSDALNEGGPCSYNCIKSRLSQPLSSTNSGGGLQVGVYRAVLGYLADPKYGLSAQARKRMVMQLQDVELFEVEEVGEAKYRVALGGKVYEATRAAYVRWEKGEKRIYVARPGGCNKMKMAYELAGELAKGVVGAERVALAEGLQELLLLAAGFEFEDKAMQELLSLRNLRLTLEDEALLQDLQESPSTFGHLHLWSLF